MTFDPQPFAIGSRLGRGGGGEDVQVKMTLCVVRGNKFMTRSDEGTMLSSRLINTVSGFPGVSDFAG